MSKDQNNREKGAYFPVLLHDLLEDAENSNESDIVSWSPNGRSFRVYKKEDFMETILPRYFRLSQYRSFVRQLNIWGFRCITKGAEKGFYQHSHFVRGKRELCDGMFRETIKGTGKKRPFIRKKISSKQEANVESKQRYISDQDEQVQERPLSTRRTHADLVLPLSRHRTSVVTPPASYFLPMTTSSLPPSLNICRDEPCGSASITTSYRAVSAPAGIGAQIPTFLSAPAVGTTSTTQQETKMRPLFDPSISNTTAPSYQHLLLPQEQSIVPSYEDQHQPSTLTTLMTSAADAPVYHTTAGRGLHHLLRRDPTSNVVMMDGSTPPFVALGGRNPPPEENSINYDWLVEGEDDPPEEISINYGWLVEGEDDHHSFAGISLMDAATTTITRNSLPVLAADDQYQFVIGGKHFDGAAAGLSAEQAAAAAATQGGEKEEADDGEDWLSIFEKKFDAIPPPPRLQK